MPPAAESTAPAGALDYLSLPAAARLIARAWPPPSLNQPPRPARWTTSACRPPRA